MRKEKSTRNSYIHGCKNRERIPDAAQTALGIFWN
jgi:hypothetical protein